MSSHEISFNTSFSEPIRTRADVIYKITPTLISITNTGLGQRSAAEDIEAVLCKFASRLNRLVQDFDHISGLLP